MTTRVEQIAEQVKALPEQERAEFLSWLLDFELKQSDDWDHEICQDREALEEVEFADRQEAEEN